MIVELGLKLYIEITSPMRGRSFAVYVFIHGRKWFIGDAKDVIARIVMRTFEGISIGKKILCAQCMGAFGYW